MSATYDFLLDEPPVGSVVSNGMDRWERDSDGWWLLTPWGSREAPEDQPARWHQLEECAGGPAWLAAR